MANAVMASRTQGWSGRVGDGAVKHRHRDMQRRDGVQGTAAELTTLHRLCGPTFRRKPVTTPQQELQRL
ncbi:MAG: hypothetical protein Q8M96_09065 [Rubrivivax sp.]|nr:hypothetical protein [Rubrivivax sp.]